MKVVVAIDSLKGSLSSLEAGQAIKEGVQVVYPEADVVVRPLADGGEGTVEALAIGMGGEIRHWTIRRTSNCQIRNLKSGRDASKNSNHRNVCSRRDYASS